MLTIMKNRDENFSFLHSLVMSKKNLTFLPGFITGPAKSCAGGPPGGGGGRVCGWEQLAVVGVGRGDVGVGGGFRELTPTLSLSIRFSRLLIQILLIPRLLKSSPPHFHGAFGTNSSSSAPPDTSLHAHRSDTIH